jgi:hypothetical protein
MTNIDAFTALTTLARDAARSIADDLTFALSTTPDKYPTLRSPFISDDRCDYNNAATDLLALLMPALTDDDPDDACTRLHDAMMRCDIRDFDPASPMRCIHDSALDFASPTFDTLPDDDACPNFD